MSEAYKAAGVDLVLSNDVSKILYEAGKYTWSNRAGLYGEIRAAQDTFRGLRTWGLAPLLEVPEPENLELDQDADGIGTKVIVSQREARYNTAAFDLIAMAIDDPASRGFEPVIVTTVLGVNRLEKVMRPAVEQLAVGAIQAARVGRVAIKGGETAVLGDVRGGYGDPATTLQYDWSATVHAVGHRDRLLDGSIIRPGQAIVAFREHGFRSNGMSLVRKTYEERYGGMWHDVSIDTPDGRRRLGELVLLPSTIYTPILVDALGGYDLRREQQVEISGAAHITGGGIVEKFGDLLRASGCGADLEDLYEPAEAMQEVQRLARVSDEEIYGVLNEGQGMLAVTSQDDKLIALCAQQDVEAKRVGTITQRAGINIRSKAAQTPGRKLAYSSE